MDGLSFFSHDAPECTRGNSQPIPHAVRPAGKRRTDGASRRCLVGARTTGGAMRKPLKIMIIGAGPGGLCLAHGLAKDGIAVEVFERDGSPADHQPGYRLSISATGSAALRSCLPDAQYRKFVAKSGDPGR